jgi:SOS response regulatory protein OraA/RecX
VPRDAESWLAERGIVREAVVAPRSAEEVRPDEPSAPAHPPPSAREVIGLARQVTADSVSRAVPKDPATVGGSGVDAPSDPLPGGQHPGDRVAAAVAFVHRSTANAPQSEGRLREKLAERGFDEPDVEEALAQARAARIVDDTALLAALITERRERGHADLRLRRDLRSRGFTGEQIDTALERHRGTDPFAAAFTLAREQARRHRTLDAEVAVRRIVGFIVRRGHSEALARKAARDAVYADREPLRTAER